jgi:hypothetical protein
MRIFASLFLLLFAADGGVSFFDELISLFMPLPVVSEFRNFMANIVIMLAVAVYFCLGIDKRLPKRVFLPLIVFVCCMPLASWFFPILSGSRTFSQLASAGQLVLCLLPVCYFNNKNEPVLVMPKSMFDAPFFSLRNTLIFAGANLFVLPLALLLVVLVAADSAMATYTSGFMHIAPDGVHMSEKTYRRGNKTVLLAGMIHVGEKNYYDQVVGSIAPGRTLVLAEGVTDDKHLLHDKPEYGKLASYLGLSSQQEKMHFKGRQIEAADLDEPSSRKSAGGKTLPARVDILRADVDVSTFRPDTIRFLNSLGRQSKDKSSLAVAYSAWTGKSITPEAQQVIMDDILYRRNKELLRHLGKAVDKYDTVVIPWGALHMLEIEQEVRKQGFALTQVQDRVSVDFKRILKMKAD